MAAHIVTALRSWERKEYINPDEWKFFIGHAPCADELSLNHWEDLNTDNSTFVSNYISLILPEYIKYWQELGYPNTHEEWCEKRHAKFMEEDSNDHIQN